MGASFGGDGDVIADINITPFVDIILVVLIIFMVTTTMVEEEVIPVQLPDAATAEKTEALSFGITLLENGALLVDGKPSNASDITRQLTEARAKTEDVTVLIAADKAVAHGRVIWVVDLVKTAGVSKFAFNVDKTNMIGPDPGSMIAEPAAAPTGP
jgi:biopolymer transport protein ExbD